VCASVDGQSSEVVVATSVNIQINICSGGGAAFGAQSRDPQHTIPLGGRARARTLIAPVFAAGASDASNGDIYIDLLLHTAFHHPQIHIL
jgi:hypothetical protein